MARRPKRSAAPEAGRLDVTALTARAAADARGADPSLLDGYLELLAAITEQPRRLHRHELDTRRAVGVRAARAGVSLASVVDLYLSATWLAWRHLPRPDGAPTEDVATYVFRAANDGIVALTDGYEGAQRVAVREEEAARQELVDDLLLGTGNQHRLLDRAARFGLRLAGANAVAVARADRPLSEIDLHARRTGADLLRRLGQRGALVTTKDSLLVCIIPGAEPATVREFTERSQVMIGSTTGQIAVGRSYSGPAGIAESYQEARDVLALAERLGLQTAVLNAADLLVFQVLSRDHAAMVDLVETVLGPLRVLRGGPRPLVDTLAAYFNHGGAVAAARQLKVGVRTVTYRLRRIRDLTGYGPTNPADRFTLQAAVLGARLLGWADAADQSSGGRPTPR